MPKHKKLEGTLPLAIRLPETLVVKLKILLLDPTTGRTKYGEMSGLFERLAREYLQKIENGEEPLPGEDS